MRVSKLTKIVPGFNLKVNILSDPVSQDLNCIAKDLYAAEKASKVSGTNLYNKPAQTKSDVSIISPKPGYCNLI